MRGPLREEAARCTSFSRATRFVLRGTYAGERTCACAADARTVGCGAHAVLQVVRSAVRTGSYTFDTTELLERGADLRVYRAERGAAPCARHRRFYLGVFLGVCFAASHYGSVGPGAALWLAAARNFFIICFVTKICDGMRKASAEAARARLCCG